MFAALALAVVATLALAQSACERSTHASPAASKDDAASSVQVFAGPGTTPGLFYTPRCLDNDGQTLWAIDRTARVQRLDPATGRCLQWFRMPDYELGKPTGVTIAPGRDGKPAIYVADTHYHRIMVYAMPEMPAETGPSAKPVEITPVLEKKYEAYGEKPGEFIYPTDVAVLMTPDNAQIDRIYVSEYGGNDRVQVFDRDWKLLSSFGHFGSSSDPDKIEFNRPQSIEFDRSTGVVRLVITDSINHRLGLFTPEGKLIKWIGSLAEGSPDRGHMRHPRGLVLPGDGTAIVVEFGNNRVEQFNLADGACLATWGGAGRDKGQFGEPWAITLLQGRLFVVDAINHRLTAFPAPPKHVS